MKQAQQDLIIWTGRKFTFQFRVIDRNGDRINLTGYTVKAECKTAPGGTFITDLGAAITEASTGLITLTLDDTATAALSAARGVWDLMLTNGDGDKLPPYIGGACDVKTSVTD